MLLPVWCCVPLLLHSRAWPVGLVGGRTPLAAFSPRRVASCILRMASPRRSGEAPSRKVLSRRQGHGRGRAARAGGAPRSSSSAQQQRAACGTPPVALRPLRDADERRPAGRRTSCARQSPGTTRRSAFAPTTAAMLQAFKEAAELEVPEAFFVLPSPSFPCPGC
jgi:hypothetical protein